LRVQLRRLSGGRAQLGGVARRKSQDFSVLSLGWPGEREKDVAQNVTGWRCNSAVHDLK
jgi:hypothetical protein